MKVQLGKVLFGMLDGGTNADPRPERLSDIKEIESCVRALQMTAVGLNWSPGCPMLVRLATDADREKFRAEVPRLATYIAENMPNGPSLSKKFLDEMSVFDVDATEYVAVGGNFRKLVAYLMVNRPHTHEVDAILIDASDAQAMAFVSNSSKLSWTGTESSLVAMFNYVCTQHPNAVSVDAIQSHLNGVASRAGQPERDCKATISRAFGLMHVARHVGPDFDLAKLLTVPTKGGLGQSPNGSLLLRMGFGKKEAGKFIPADSEKCREWYHSIIDEVDTLSGVTLTSDDEHNVSGFRDFANGVREIIKAAIGNQAKRPQSLAIAKADLKAKLDALFADAKPVKPPVEANAKPVEAKPVEAKPVEAKPVEAKPVEAKPVAIAAGKRKPK